MVFRGSKLQLQLMSLGRAYSNYGFRIQGLEKIALFECFQWFGAVMAVSWVAFSRRFLITSQLSHGFR